MLTNMDTKIDSNMVHYESNLLMQVCHGYACALKFYRPDSIFVFWSVKFLKITSLEAFFTNAHLFKINNL